jgi:hypothetical protein
VSDRFIADAAAAQGEKWRQAGAAAGKRLIDATPRLTSVSKSIESHYYRFSKQLSIYESRPTGLWPETRPGGLFGSDPPGMSLLGCH